MHNFTVAIVNGSYFFLLQSGHFDRYSLKFEISGRLCYYVNSLPFFKRKHVTNSFMNNHRFQFKLCHKILYYNFNVSALVLVQMYVRFNNSLIDRATEEVFPHLDDSCSRVVRYVFHIYFLM